MDNNTEIEMTTKPSTSKDKASLTKDNSSDRPPTPPRRDFKAEENSTRVEPDAKRKTVRLFPRPEVIYKPENTENWMTLLKNLLIVLNLLIWIFGAALTGIGIWIKVDKDFWAIQTGLNVEQFSSAGSLLIAAGVIIMVFGLVGCYGAFSQTVWMLILYAVVVVIILLLEIAVMALVWSAISNKDFIEDIKSQAKKAIQEMSRDDKQLEFLNIIQTRLQCCGVDGADDYQEDGIPNSCTDTETGLPYVKGCFEKLVEYLKSKAGILGGLAVVVLILQVAALVLTCCVACGVKNAAENAIF